ncbi:MAG: O-antigen polymerase [Gammaproteobacteria bacterium]
MSWSALAIFVIGVICFTAGAAIGHGGVHRRLRAPAPQQKEYLSDRIILWALGVCLVAGMPFFLQQIGSFTSAPVFSPAYFMQVRAGLLNQAAELNRAPLVDNLVALSSVAALIAYAVTDAARRSRLLVWGLIMLAIFYNLLTASKAGVVSLVIALFAVHVLLRRRVSVRFLMLTFGGVLVLFGVVTVGRVESLGQHLTWQQAIQVTWEWFLGYFTESPVGFGIYLNHPNWVSAVWSPWRFFERTANYFGNYFPVPDFNAQFVEVGPGKFYNTYTVFFSYYPAYGIGGVIGFMFGLGLVSAWIYRLALSRSPVGLVVYGVVFDGILMTIFSESLLLGLNFTFKLVLIALVIQGVRHIRLRRRSVAMADGVPRAAIDRGQ